MVYLQKLSRAQSKAIDKLGAAEQTKKNRKPPKLDPVYRDMQKTVDVMKYQNRRKLGIQYY